MSIPSLSNFKKNQISPFPLALHHPIADAKPPNWCERVPHRAVADNDLRNSPQKLCLRCQKTFQGNISTLRCHHSHIADILLSLVVYFFARRRLMLRWSQAFCWTESGILIAADDISICSSAEKTRANTGVSSASIFTTALWCGFTSSFEVGLGSFVPVACLRRMANAL